jgi:UDP-N-acetylmuramate dehydrogenase
MALEQPVISEAQAKALRSHFGERLLQGQVMARYSAMHIGGPADFLISVRTGNELEDAIRFLWENSIPFLILGSGSNTLISDQGIRELVVINEAKDIKFITQGPGDLVVWAESGASFGKLARRTGPKGWSGLEWAAAIPGTVGGAVVNNAGAFGSNVAASLEVADILQPIEGKLLRSQWSAVDFEYDYRSSVIKSGKHPAVVLSATFRLEKSTPAEVKNRISEVAGKRRASQPQGASLGSMFKNPPGDYSGRLIEEAGLKGTRIGDAEISTVHGNFFLNRGKASALDIAALIALAKDTVAEKYGVELELEIQFIGDWSDLN